MPRTPLVALALLFVLPSAAAAQRQGATLLAGYGGIEQEVSLGPAYHLNVRHPVFATPAFPLPTLVAGELMVPTLQIEAEAFAQVGESGTLPVACDLAPGGVCARQADRLYLAGVGVVSRWDAVGPRHPVQLYFLPLTAGAYVRGSRIREQLFPGYDSSFDPVSVRTAAARRLSAAVGNGMGVRVRLGDVLALLEVRAMLTLDSEGEKGGSLPVGLGVMF